MRPSDPYLPVGTSDGDSYFSLPSAGNDDHDCEGEGCEGCYELFLRSINDRYAYLDEPWKKERE